MSGQQVVAIGRLLSDATRVSILDALFDGRAYTVNELARHGRVAASTASEHLARLLDGGLVATEAQGRHRYYRLHGPEVAQLLESVFEFTAHASSGLNPRVPADLAYARSCYDHLAGTVAVALADHLVALRAVEYVDATPRLTEIGANLFEPFDLAITSRSAARPVVRRCLDWSERRPHLAGSLPASFLEHMLNEQWIRRRQRRALEFTETGRRQLVATLGFTLPQYAAQHRTGAVYSDPRDRQTWHAGPDR